MLQLGSVKVTCLNTSSYYILARVHPTADSGWRLFSVKFTAFNEQKIHTPCLAHSYWYVAAKCGYHFTEHHVELQGRESVAKTIQQQTYFICTPALMHPLRYMHPSSPMSCILTRLNRLTLCISKVEKRIQSQAQILLLQMQVWNTYICSILCPTCPEAVIAKLN